ncbi:hypothetical protein Zm00014a_016264 [Zea mays]|uniref:Uncharacterized protein n=1 Tax=Zea mays TaxID=4577 RepID=A0A317Y5I9_MAIZE|nr:hypothetical protein Zm00014a_016264 [Zea mays]
MGRRTNGPG